MRTSPVAVVSVLLLTGCLWAAAAYDHSRSRFWSALSAGTPQVLLIHGSSLSHPTYSPWSSQIGPAIEAQVGSGLLTVHNLAMFVGNSSSAARQRMDTVVALRPDAVILEFAANDAVNRLDCTIDSCAGPNLAAMVDTLHATLPSCDIFLYVTAPPWDTVSCGATACRYCTEVFAQRCRRSARASNDDTVEQYYDNVRVLADRYNTHMVDTYAAFRAIYDTSYATYRDWLYDGVHPSDLASRTIIVPAMLAAMQGTSAAQLSPGAAAHRVDAATRRAVALRGHTGRPETTCYDLYGRRLGSAEPRSGGVFVVVGSLTLPHDRGQDAVRR